MIRETMQEEGETQRERGRERASEGRQGEAVKKGGTETERK